jgi:hypothetical protein
MHNTWPQFVGRIFLLNPDINQVTLADEYQEGDVLD